MEKNTTYLSTFLLAGFLIITLAQGGCQSFPASKKKDDYGKDFQQRVAEDPFPPAGASVR